MSTPLSARQEQCVRLTAFRTDKEIALHLGISEATVKKHVHEACQRLGVNRRKAALAILDHNGPGSTNGAMTSEAQPALAPVEDRSVREWVGAHTRTPAEVQTPVTVARRNSSARPQTESVFDGGTFALTGYMAPPRDPLVRLAMILVMAIVICAMLIAVGGLVSELHKVVDQFGLH